MPNFSTNEFKPGLKVMLDNEPCSIMENEYVKPGKGQAFNRVKLRNLRSGRVLEKTFKSGDSLEGADVLDIDLEYSYTDGEFWYFMDPNTFEQHSADKAAIADAEKWLKEQEKFEVTLFNGAPLRSLHQTSLSSKLLKPIRALKAIQPKAEVSPQPCPRVP